MFGASKANQRAKFVMSTRPLGAVLLGASMPSQHDFYGVRRGDKGRVVFLGEFPSWILFPKKHSVFHGLFFSAKVSIYTSRPKNVISKELGLLGLLIEGIFRG